MTFLLDVNALVALGFTHHEFHDRMARWVKAQEFPTLATCSITELGFVRILAQASSYGLTVAEARNLLLRLKRTKTLPFLFIPDDHDILHLPVWAKAPKQTTDAHLAQLAREHGLMLATLDARIRAPMLSRRSDLYVWNDEGADEVGDTEADPDDGFPMLDPVAFAARGLEMFFPSEVMG